MADQGAASFWWNPAAIGGVPGGASFGATGILPSGRTRDAGTLIRRPGAAAAPVGGSSPLSDPIQRGVAPNGALAIPLVGGLAAGLSVTSPFSFTTDYDATGWQRYSAIRTRLTTIDVQPGLAWSPAPGFSVGAALNAEYSDALLSNALPNLAAGLPDARLRLKGHGWDYGWSAGAQVRPAPGVSLGIAYKSSITHRLDGTVSISGLLGPLAARNVDASTRAVFSTPWQLIVGGRAQVAPHVTLNAQAVRFGWSRFDQLAVGAPLNSATPENYRDTWSVAVGVDAEVSPRLTLRAGIQRDPTPTRDSSRDARVPDGDRTDFNAGLSYRLGGRFTLDAAAAYTRVASVPITRPEHFYAGTAAQTDVTTSGFADRQHVFVVALGGRIGF